MSVIAARVLKYPSHSSGVVDLGVLWKRLPFAGTPHVDKFASPTNQVALYNYGSAYDTTIESLPDGNALILKGQQTESTRSRVLNILNGHRKDVRMDEIPEQMIAIYITPTELRILSGSPGIEQLLMYEDANAIYFSNQPAILGEWIPDATPTNKENLAWMLHKSHIHGYGYFFEGIKRTEPGTKYSVSSEGIKKTLPQEIDYHFASLDDAEAVTQIAEISKEVRRFVTNVEVSKKLSLSGGKDSRALLGLLGAEDSLTDFSFSTFGEHYAPDVMAAQAVAKVGRFSDRHTISVPPLIQSAPALALRLAQDLMVDFAGTSFADIRPVSVRNDLKLGGHEYGTKDLKTFPSRDEFIRRRLRAFDTSLLLNEEARVELKNIYKSDLISIIEGVPDSKLNTFERIKFRLPMNTAATITSINTTAGEFHPFIDGRFIRLMLEVKPEFTDSQMFHYILNRMFEHPIELAPYAGDNWPATTENYANSLGLPFRGHPANMYRYNPAFPSQSSFGRYNWRIKLFEGMRVFLLQQLQDNRERFDYLDIDNALNLIQKDSSKWSFVELYRLGALLKVCLIEELGTTLLHNGNSDRLSQRIADFFDDESPSSGSSSNNSNETEIYALKESATKSAIAIRDLAEQLHNLESTDSVVKKSQLYDILLRFRDDLALFESTLSPLLDLKKIDCIQKGSRNEAPIFLSFDKDGLAQFACRLFRPENHRVLLGIRGPDSSEVIEGLNWSLGGFWYRYLSEDETGDVIFPLTWVAQAGKSVEAFVSVWKGNDCVFISS